MCCVRASPLVGAHIGLMARLLANNHESPVFCAGRGEATRDAHELLAGTRVSAPPLLTQHC